jgi:carbon storage regulator
MLVLSRQQGQVICIGDDITICVTQIEGGTVKIGIDAPKSVRIDRKEVRAARLTHSRTSLLELRDIYFMGIVDRANGLIPKLEILWGASAHRAYALAFEEYQ